MPTTLKKGIDRQFFTTTFMLVMMGFLIFLSASLGLLASSYSEFRSVIFNQLVLGLIGGGIAAYAGSRIPYTFWQKNAFYIFIASCLLMALVYVPHVKFCHGGACRWISVGSFNLQPVEVYKLAFIMYLAALLGSVKKKISTFKLGTLPFLVLVAITAALVLTQPDTDTFIVITIAGVAMFVSAGGRWRDMFILGLIAVIGLAGLIAVRPYLMQRIQTFMNPANDPLGSGYQIQQSLIAIGSGGIWGKGFGQSVQKFNFLPEPIGDSIFAVAGEEFGFIGAVFIVLLYLAFTFQGYKIAARAPDLFSGMLVVGIITLITLQSFLNIAAMLGILPLSGTPLLFISHGGTALFFALASVGIVFNISRYQKKV